MPPDDKPSQSGDSPSKEQVNSSAQLQQEKPDLNVQVPSYPYLTEGYDPDRVNKVKN